MEVQAMTLAAFLASVDQKQYFLVEKHQQSYGYTVKLVALADCDYAEGAERQVIVIWDEDKDCAILSQLHGADPSTIVVKGRRVAFAQNWLPARTVVLYPVAEPEWIQAHARVLAAINESLRGDGCTDEAELRKEAREDAQMDFNRRLPLYTYHTDDEPAYLRIFEPAYIEAYIQAVQERERAQNARTRRDDDTSFGVCC